MNPPPGWEPQDRAHIWHPYAPAGAPALFRVTDADGVYLTLESPSGQQHRVIDAMSSWWCMIHGYNQPHLNEALHAQVEKFSHVMFGGLTHDPALGLAETLVEMAPAGLNRVFLADSGSVAMEVALKTAFQAAAGRGRREAQQVLTIAGGYHGDTLGDMALCDPDNGMHAVFAGVLPRHIFAPKPPLADTLDAAQVDVHLKAQTPAVDAWAAEVEKLIIQHHDCLAAIVVEPILQGAGGMRPYPAACLQHLRRLCDTYELLLVVDEIATGFGRTGTHFGVDHAGITPDIMCVGKALTGGYMTQAAMLVTDDVGQWVNHSEAGALLHGPTFMANPLACAVSQASLELLNQNRWPLQVATIESILSEELSKLNNVDGVARVNVLGAVGVVELDHPADMVRATTTAIDHGVWIRPYGKLLYSMPPYIASEEHVRTIGKALVAAAQTEIDTFSGSVL